MHEFINPYSDQSFIGFFSVLLQRFWFFLSGKIEWASIASDEIQILVLIGISASASLVGVFLVLRKMTMLANALSHTILLGIVSVYLLMMFFSTSGESYGDLSIPYLMTAAFLTGIVTTFLTQMLTKFVKLQQDASIGLVFTGMFALGIVCITLFSKNVHIGTELVMGSVDALQRGDIKIVYSVLLVNLILYGLFYRGFKITTFDPELSKFFGFFPGFFNYLLMVQTSLTAIAAFRAVGVLMVLAFLVAPILAARLLSHSLRTLIFLSLSISVLSSLLGVAISRQILTTYDIGFSTGGIVVILLGIAYVAAACFRLKKTSAFILNKKQSKETDSSGPATLKKIF